MVVLLKLLLVCYPWFSCSPSVGWTISRTRYQRGETTRHWKATGDFCSVSECSKWGRYFIWVDITKNADGLVEVVVCRGSKSGSSASSVYMPKAVHCSSHFQPRFEVKKRLEQSMIVYWWGSDDISSLSNLSSAAYTYTDYHYSTLTKWSCTNVDYVDYHLITKSSVTASLHYRVPWPVNALHLCSQIASWWPWQISLGANGSFGVKLSPSSWSPGFHSLQQCSYSVTLGTANGGL